MTNSILIQYLLRSVSRLQPLDYVLLGALGVAVLITAFLVLRILYRFLFKPRSRALRPSAPTESAVFDRREILELSQAERQYLERQIASLEETFASLRTAYEEKRSSGAMLDDLCERLFNYSLSLRGAFLQILAATNAFLGFERMKSLLILYASSGVEERYKEAPRARELEAKLSGIKNHVVDPLLDKRGLDLPDPQQFFSQFTVPGPKKADVEVFNGEMDSVYQVMKSYVERSLKGRRKFAVLADTTGIRKMN